jgi:glycosyltransferase involved in cell wall biosynthesis
MGVKASYGSPQDIYASVRQLQFYRTIIFYRMPMSDLFMIYFDEARRLGMKIGYDIDDPSFDNQSLGSNQNLRVIEPFYRQNQLRDSIRFRQAMDCCDFLISSTPHLTNLMQQTTGNKNSFVWRNVADEEAVEAGKWASSFQGDSSAGCTIGYFSGSLAHEADFDEALPAISRIMTERADTKLLVAGHLRDRKEFNDWGDRLQRHAFSGYTEYLKLIAQCDLVIIPLVDAPFNRSKSVVRFIDAAVVGVPVVASAVGDYDNLLKDKKNGFKVCDKSNWHESIILALDNRKLRHSVGSQAREFVLSNYSTHSYKPDISKELSEILFGEE